MKDREKGHYAKFSLKNSAHLRQKWKCTFFQYKYGQFSRFLSTFQSNTYQLTQMQIIQSSLLSDKRIEHSVAAIGSIAIAIALVKTTLALVKCKVRQNEFILFITILLTVYLERYLTFSCLQIPFYRIYLFILCKSIAIRKNNYRKIWIGISYAFTWCYYYYCWRKGCS